MCTMPQLTTGQWLPTVVFVRTNVTGENNFAEPVLSISETSTELLVVHNALREVTELVLPAFFLLSLYSCFNSGATLCGFSEVTL